MSMQEGTHHDLDDHVAAVAWLARTWDPDLTVGDWWQLLASARLAAPTFPVPWGRGWRRDRMAALFRAMADRSMLRPPYGMGHYLVTPTLLEHARPDIVERFVPDVVNGRSAWCQLFSEPGAGSDLAGLQTRAVRDGDEWVVSGQKVWTSGGHIADFGILIARTDPTVAKHHGLTYFVLPMRQPGVEVRPLREMTGKAMFNEVFLDEARIPHDWVVGELNGGWAVTNTTLRHERAEVGGDMASGLGGALPGSVAGHLELRSGDFATSTRARRPRIDHALLRNLAVERGRAGDPIVRQHLMQLYALERVTEWHLGRIKSGDAATGVDQNLAKIRSTKVIAAQCQVITDLLGPEASLWQIEETGIGSLQWHLVSSPGPSIYSGSDNIQRNIIGERGLGLDREPDATHGLPFAQLLHNPTRTRPSR